MGVGEPGSEVSVLWTREPLWESHQRPLVRRKLRLPKFLSVYVSKWVGLYL